MAAATENFFQQWQNDRVRDHQVAAGSVVTDIFKGTLVVVLTATGFAEPATNAAGRVFAGVALEEVNQLAAVAANTNQIRLAQTGVFEFNAAGLTQADVLKKVHVTDDNIVQLAAGGTPIRVGTIVEVISATRAKVAIDVQIP